MTSDCFGIVIIEVYILALLSDFFMYMAWDAILFMAVEIKNKNVWQQQIRNL